MTSSHLWIADCFFVIAAILFTFKFLTWGEPKNGTHRVLVLIAVLLLHAIMVIWNHKLNQVATGPLAPFLRIEPEVDGQLSNTGSFTLQLVNYGVDVEHPKALLDYFVAQKNDGIHIKRIVHMEELARPVILRSNQSLPITVSFAGHVEMAYRLALATSPVPSLLGVRITVTFRRFSDQKEFDIVRAFRAEKSDWGEGASDLMELSGPSGKYAERPRDGTLTLDEVMPKIVTTERWSELSITFKDGKWVSAR